MKLHMTWMLVLASGVAVGTPGYSAEPNEEAAAIAAIEKLGGTVEVDEKRPEKPVVSVHLRDTKVTDARLVHLIGLPNLQGLNLAETKVTDAGLKHLKGLGKLRHLDLSFTSVADRGLVHIKGLTNLKWLDLDDTRITDEGVKKLQQPLPDCEIEH